MTQARNPFSDCYWSSGPSDDAESSETLDFKLAHPLCVVHEIQLQPCEADRQLVSGWAGRRYAID